MGSGTPVVSVTIQDKAFIAAVAGLDERRPNDRAAILKAYRSTYGVGEDAMSDRAVMGAVHRLMKQDEAKDHAKTIETVKEGAQGKAAAEEAGKLVTLAMQEQEDMRQARANVAAWLRGITGALAKKPDLDGKKVSLAGASKFIKEVFAYDVADDDGLDADTARVLQEAVGAEAQPAQTEPLPLPEPEPKAKGVAWPGIGGHA